MYTKITTEHIQTN